MDVGFETKFLATIFLCILCVVFCVKIAIQLRRAIPARVNCWFCNNNFWVKYSLKNSWICQNCDQYNGFSKDGDYNKPLNMYIKTPVHYNKNRSHITSTTNGLCYKCNTNQQLKVMQLSSFKPMNERNFDNEIDSFKLHLEKVYQLCSLCKTYVRDKLRKEKAHFLGTKLIHSRTEKPRPEHFKNGVNFFKKFTMKALKFSAFVLLICILTDVYFNIDLFLSKKIINDSKRHFTTVKNQLKNISLNSNDYLHTLYNLTESYSSIIPTFVCEIYNSTLNYFDLNEKSINLYQVLQMEHISLTYFLELLPLIGCILQFMLRISDINVSLRYFIHDIGWMLSVYISRNSNKILHPFQIILMLFIMSYPMTGKGEEISKVFKKASLKKFKNLDSSMSTHNDDDLISEDSDSDVRSSTPIYSQTEDIRPPWMSSEYSPRQDFNYAKSMSSNPSCFNGSLYSRNMSNNFKSGSYFSNPVGTSDIGLLQRKYDNNELNDSISGLHLGKQNGQNKNSDFVFSTRQYKCTSPSFFMPSPPHTAGRPILSPSRFTHSTQQSWVAGGYWGADSPRQTYNLHDTSRSSSQSSGFESLSSAHHRNVNSLPHSRDESITSDYNKKNDSNFSYNKNLYINTSLGGNSAFQSFQSRNQHVPIYPSMQSHKSVFIPSSVPYNFQTNGSIHSSNNSFLTASNPNHTFKPLFKPVFNE